MPTYDYVCQACGHKLEIFQSMTESPKKKCPKCKKSKLERQIGRGAAILFKGSGFYQTDYRSNSYTEGAKKDAPKSAPKNDQGDPAKDAGGDAPKKDAGAPKAPAKPAAKDQGSKSKD